MDQAEPGQPSIWKFATKVAAAAGLAGIVCCVAPAVLFMLGLAGGVWAISFADFFYEGSGGVGKWILRSMAVMIGLVGLVIYKRKQDQCSLDPKRKRMNLILLSTLIAVLGVGLFFILDRASAWYFDKYIVPAQEAELAEKSP
ncbi:MAG: hypothetical protein CMJ20_09730 [Phycisphaeraceae bacterium]|nr:hypothetical protein [Phycisphaeraceae bacterium]